VPYHEITPHQKLYKMKSILIVDDEKDNLDAMKRLLRSEYDVHITASATDALKSIRETEFAVIVSDQRMPEITGVELLEKAKGVCPDTVRILLTGYTDLDSVIGAINRGNIYRYIAKPWDPEDLRLTLRQATETYDLKKQLQLKNAELEQKNAALEKAFAELKNLDTAKGRFLTLVSHELNTPLTVMTGFISLLEDGRSKLTNETQRSIQHLKAASDRLKEIIDEVILYVRLEADNKWQKHDFDWDQETLDQIQFLAKERQSRQVGIRVRSKNKPHSDVDAPRMRILLHKLLKDAVQRSLPQKEVIISIAIEGDKLRFGVWRTGEALAPESLELFDPTANMLHHSRNLGLALPLSRLIVEKHRGEMTVPESTLEKGTTIQFLLPLKER
jgi:two-component system sensor histidine kinase/response regulator